MILKFHVQTIHIWRHHSRTYYQQPLIQQQILIMKDRIKAYQAWRSGAVVIATAQLHSSMSELRFCAGSNSACGVSEIRDGENLWQWPRLQITLKRLSSVHHTTKTIHHHDHDDDHHQAFQLKINLSNNRLVQVRKFPRATVDDLLHHALPIMRKQPKFLIINDVSKLISRGILVKLPQLKSFIARCENKHFYTSNEIRQPLSGADDKTIEEPSNKFNKRYSW